MKHRWAVIAPAVFAPLAIIAALAGATPILLPAAAAGVGSIVLGARRAPGFWRKLAAGAAGGALAGLLVLGPGMRIAMRLVAIADPARRPEFTLEGTMFIIVFLGLMMGATFGIAIGLLDRVVDRRWLTLGISLLGIASLFINDELRRELLELGFGWPVNIPLFWSVFYGWANLSARMARRLAATKEAPNLVDLGASA